MRARDVRQILSKVADTDGSASLITLTMRHRAGMPLAGLWESLRYSWDAATSGKAWKNSKDKLGVRGHIRTVEATHGEHGWHLHIHAVVIFEDETSLEVMEHLGMGMFTRWASALDRKGLSSVAEKGGLDVRKVRMSGESLDSIADYISKISFEVTSPSTKDGRYGNRAPFAVLRDALETGLADDVELWWEWEKASHGRKQVTYSRGLRDWARLDQERTDEEIVAEDLRGEDVLAICPESWPLVRDEIEDLLDTIELEGVAAGMRWLSSRGARWTLPAHKGDHQ